MTSGFKAMMAIGLAGAIGGVALAQATGVQPGMWEYAVTINTVDAPGAPAFIANMMRGKTTKIKHCLTAEEASQGPQEVMKTTKSCSFTKYSLVGSQMNTQMTCAQGGSTTVSTSSGTITPTSFTATGKSVTTGGAMPMTVTTSSTGHRIGECK